MVRVSRLGVIVLGIVVLLAVSAQFARLPLAEAATIAKLRVTCSQVIVAGKTEVKAPFVRVVVVNASNLTSIIAQKVVPTRPRVGADYSAVLDLSASHLPAGTLLVIAVGEWNGVKFLKPATIISQNCSGEGGTPPPTPTQPPVGTPPPTPTQPPVGTPPPTPTQPPVGTPPPTPSQPPVGTPPPTPHQ